MERRKGLFAAAFLIACLIPTISVFADHGIFSDNDTAAIDEAPPAPPPGGKRPEGEKSDDIESLKGELKKGTPGSAAWWSTAHKFLDKMTADGKLKADDAKAFANTLEAGGKDRLNALVDARGNADINALRKAANTGSGAAKEASQQEVFNRMQDKNAKLTKDLFGSRIERAIRDVTKLLKTGMSPEDAGKYIATQMMRTIGKATEIPALLAAVEKLLAKPSDELKKEGYDEKLLKWFRGDAKAALQFTEGSKTDLAKVKTETPHEKAFAEAYKAALGENEEFWRKVAVKNDKTRSKEERDAASAWLKDNYFGDDDAKEGVADFVGRSDKNKNDGAGVDVAMAFGRELPDGSFVWDGTNTNVALGDKAKNQVEFMGKTKEQIRAFISAKANMNMKDHDVAAGMDPGTSNGFNLSTPNADAAKAEGVVRRFAKKGSDGRPKFELQTEPGWTGTPAEQDVEVPNIPPVVPTPTPTPTPGGPGDSSGVDAPAVIASKCNQCHGVSRPPYGGGAAAAASMIRANRMPPPNSAALTAAERDGVLRFLDNQSRPVSD